MSKINFKKIAAKIISVQPSEKNINDCKIFYKTYLINLKQREEILTQLYQYCLRFQNIKFTSAFFLDKEGILLEREISAFLSMHFGEGVTRLYHKKLPEMPPKREVNPDGTFWQTLIVSLSNTFETVNEKSRQELNYRRNFLTFLNNCLFNFGLHPDILLRKEAFKRYNIQIEHNFKSRKIIAEYKLLLRPEKLQTDYLDAYRKKLPLQINGKLIPFKSLYSIKITSTLLQDDEIELFARKNNFNWKSTEKDGENFTALCKDETDHILKNPFLNNDEIILRNSNLSFIHPSRITELKAIKSKEFDFAKLIQLCEEVNIVTANQNYIAVSLLVRSIIDHIPPYFKCSNFNELANNYNAGTKSFKKSMQTLNTSLRYIADNNIHSQIRKKEILPTPNQIDFSPELDLLLSEIIRTAK